MGSKNASAWASSETEILSNVGINEPVLCPVAECNATAAMLYLSSSKLAWYPASSDDKEWSGRNRSETNIYMKLLQKTLSFQNLSVWELVI